MLKTMENRGNRDLLDIEASMFLVGHMVVILADLLVTLMLAANNYGHTCCKLRPKFYFFSMSSL